jgi:methyl-accepting chemotaxis protein
LTEVQTQFSSLVEENNQKIERLEVFCLVVIAALIAVAVALSLFFAFYISGLISKPLAPLVAFMKKAGSSGDLSLGREDLELINKMGNVKDEIGQTVNSAASFMRHVTEVSETLTAIADGDLTPEVRLLSDNDTMGLALRNMLEHLNSMFGEISTSASQVSIGSKQISDGAQTLAQGSMEQASSVSELLNSISDIADKTKMNAKMSERTAALVNTIKDNAEKGSRHMDEMTAAVSDIEHASQSIGNVIKVINDIAFQTNILSLNASVEAARAGQHGKGFAIVAEEVRGLAVKSAEAAKQTGNLIADSVEKSKLGSRIAVETADSFKEIVAGVNESSRLVGEIALSSDEQSAGIARVNTGIDQVAQVIQQNSATAEENAAASEEMNAQSDTLESLVAQFKLKDDGSSRHRSRSPEGGIAPRRKGK